MLQVIAMAAASPLKIFLLAGQSNMVGWGSLEHLNILVNDTSSVEKNEYREALWNGSGYRISEKVFVKFNDRRGGLTVGPDSGFAARDHLGPELMIGWTLDEAAKKNEKMLLIKTAWGGKSLAVDFRPPSSGEGDYGEKPIKYGWFYRQMIVDILDALDHLPTYVPGYNIKDGYELSGFFWFQGWNDLINPSMVNEYGNNLRNFIRDVRRDLDAPELPFIIGELGMHGMHPTGPGSLQVILMRSYEQTVTLLDEFRNNTLFVRTAPYAVMNGKEYTGMYHYYGRADTYFHIGQALGKGMLQLIQKEQEALIS